MMVNVTGACMLQDARTRWSDPDGLGVTYRMPEDNGRYCRWYQKKRSNWRSL